MIEPFSIRSFTGTIHASGFRAPAQMAVVGTRCGLGVLRSSGDGTLVPIPMPGVTTGVWPVSDAVTCATCAKLRHRRYVEGEDLVLTGEAWRAVAVASDFFRVPVDVLQRRGKGRCTQDEARARYAVAWVMAILHIDASWRELGEMLGMPAETVRYRVRRAEESMDDDGHYRRCVHGLLANVRREAA